MIYTFAWVWCLRDIVNTRRTGVSYDNVTNIRSLQRYVLLGLASIKRFEMVVPHLLHVHVLLTRLIMGRLILLYPLQGKKVCLPEGAESHFLLTFSSACPSCLFSKTNARCLSCRVKGTQFAVWSSY